MSSFEQTQGLPVVAPTNMLPVQVVRREIAAPDVVTIYMTLPGTQQAPAPYLPGQFVTLALPTPRETLYRSYSLCGDGDSSQPWELTIKRVHMGAVSTYFYDSVFEGTLLYASLPRGTFTLPPRIPPGMSLIMVAAGTGITPIMGMLRALANMPRPRRPLVQLHYASKSPQDIIFRRELQQMDRRGSWLRQRYYLSSDGDHMTAKAILELAGNMAGRSHWYICGPEELKHELQSKLAKRRVPPQQVHSEVFATKSGPAYRVEARGGAGVGGTLEVVETGAVLDVRPQETLLTALERHGYRPRFDCRTGTCGACKLKVVSGQVDPVGEALSPAERSAGYVLGCVARPIGEVAIASGGRPPAGVARVADVTGINPSSPRTGATALVRLGTLVGVSALVLTAWNFTDHKPASWTTAAATPAPTQQQVIAAPDPSAKTPTPTASGGAEATATSAPAPIVVAPTATPKPKPVATSTPSPTPKH